MPPKRKQAFQSTVTLHNFFASPSTSKNAKATPPSPASNAKRTSRAILPKDIIVIDSDSDDESKVVRTAPILQRSKRRKLSESSGEVEFVESSLNGRQTSREIYISSGVKNTYHKLHNGRSAPILGTSNEVVFSESSTSSTLKTQSQRTEMARPLLFGVPPVLLSNTSMTKAESPFTTLTFGQPSSLLGSSANISVPRHPHTDIAEPRPPIVSQKTMGLEDEAKINPECLADPVNEWGTGDDESSLKDGEDSDGFEEITAPYTSTGEDFREDLNVMAASHEKCPSCGRGSSQIDLRLHINNCSDTVRTLEMGASSDTAPTLAIKPFHPLSLLPRPHRPQQPADQDGKSNNGFDAFSVLMSSHKENETWKEASVVEDPSFRPAKGNGGRRKAPFYKVLQGMPIAVDAFRYGAIPGVTAYFLTHAHSDHYTNLSSNWKNGPIYCSEGTANLVVHMLSVDQKWVHPLPMDVATEIPETGGVRVTLIEANHCPGSCLFYFEGPQTLHAGDSVFRSPCVGSSKTFRYLHCGDFRASPQHILHPAIKGKRIDHVYLDTTYLDPKYTFPPQPLVISACAELARRLVSGEPTRHDASTMHSWFTTNDKAAGKHKAKLEKTLVIVGTYSIGKERIVKEIAAALKTKVYCDPRKAAILRCQADPELNDLLTSSPLAAGVHVVPLSMITSDRLKTYIERFKGQFSKAVGFRPTGWTFTQAAGTDQAPSISSILSRSQQPLDFTYTNFLPARNSTPALQIYPIPYSEHSSFFELTCFAMSFDWGKMIATVNVGSETSRGKMAKWVAKWEAERKTRGKGIIVPHRHPDYW